VVDVSQLDLLKPSNVRRYKAAANKFGPTVKQMLVVGKLNTWLEQRLRGGPYFERERNRAPTL